jgi:ABC-2 type transport system permease protein
MIDVNQLWKKRYAFYNAELCKYGRLIFNDHLRIVLVFALGAAAFYYQQWLEQLQSDFPAVFVVTLVLSVVLTYSPIRTFLKDPDLVFLLPIETKLNPYFQKSKLTSLMVQSFFILLTAMVLAPLYFHENKITLLHFLVVLFFLMLSKAWNIFLTWQMLYSNEQLSLFADVIIRFTINIVFVFLLLSEANMLYVAAMGLLMIVLLVYFKQNSQNKILKWERLIELDAKRMMFFYRIANLFTDVPVLKNKVSRRKWLNILTKAIPHTKEATFEYLYMKSFIRGSDYFGVYVRLLVIGGMLVLFLPFYYGKIMVYFLFVYLAILQLIPLYRQHAVKIWIDLYPISIEGKQSSFLRVLFRLTVTFSVLLSFFFVFSGEYTAGVASLPLGIIFSYLFVFSYIKKKLHSYERI